MTAVKLELSKQEFYEELLYVLYITEYCINLCFEKICIIKTIDFNTLNILYIINK